MAPVHEVAFELECFEWAEERLEVAGRWKGLAGRRLSRPVLTVTAGTGRRKRLVALPGGHLGAGSETWRATFAWAGDPAEIRGAALEVGGSLVVDLPLPDRRRRRRKRPPAESADEALLAEVGVLRGQVDRLRAELAGRERELMELRARSDEAAAGPAAGELTVEIERLTGERDGARAELSAEVERLQRERDETGAEAEAERARLQSQLDDLREAFSDAAAEAETMRDQHRAALEALHEQLRIQGAAAVRTSVPVAARAELPAPATESARRRADAPRAATVEASAEAESGTAVSGSPRPEPDKARAGATAAALHALRARLGSVLSTNGHGQAAAEREPDEPEQLELPRPRRTAAAARARAGATVAARRSPVEVWGMRVLAGVAVAVMLITMLLFLVSLA